mmetsp:Transcript_50923/g.90998  ORF Transcript_50923/g.90998 Transcript_50923/m.90998 type:complete len:223 (+) Transcript_50923:922-1590(+)
MSPRSERLRTALRAHTKSSNVAPHRGELAASAAYCPSQSFFCCRRASSRTGYWRLSICLGCHRNGVRNSLGSTLRYHGSLDGPFTSASSFRARRVSHAAWSQYESATSGRGLRSVSVTRRVDLRGTVTSSSPAPTSCVATTPRIPSNVASPRAAVLMPNSSVPSNVSAEGVAPRGWGMGSSEMPMSVAGALGWATTGPSDVLAAAKRLGCKTELNSLWMTRR